MLRRLLERPCTLALLVGSQLAVMMYLSLGGFRSLSALFGREQGPTFDYSHPRDVYSNLSHLPGAPGAAGAPAQALPYCPERSPFLVGPVSVSFSPVPSLAEIVERNPRVESGGRYRPAGCEPRSRTAIIVPHRAREHHLRLLLYHLHPFLQRQQLAYGIYVIHQAGNGTFNRAKLLNVGVREALRDEEWDCLFLHDVDLLPENDHNLYVCDPRGPRHVAVAMNKFGYSLPYPQYFGGVSALTPDQYLKMNGFPNEYWGWGGEDDDIATRVRLAGMKISRPPTSVGHYKMVKHRGDKGNEENPHSSPGTRDRKGWVLTQEEDYECQHPLNNNEHPLYNPGSRPERLVRLLWNACWSSPSNMDRWVCSAWKRLGKQDRMLSSRLLPANTPRHRLSMAKDATSGPRRRWAKLCTVSSGSLPLGFINSLSPAQNRGLEKGGEGRSSPLRPEGRGCRAPPTYRNLFWAAG